MSEKISYQKLRSEVEQIFSKSNVNEIADIDWIFSYVTGKKRSMLPFLSEVTSIDAEKILEIANKRASHIPLDYILGKTNFYGFDFVVNENVLIPRIDTEVLIEIVVGLIKTSNKKVSVLDIGTGSGAIAVTLQKLTGAKVTAVDISDKALEVAKLNAKNNNADVKFVKSNLFENIEKFKVDFIVSNPPYIKSDIIKTLDAEVKDNEPILALDGGADGLDYYRKIIIQAKNHLNEFGYLCFEIGEDQAEDVSKLMEREFYDIKVVKDYAGNDRVVYGKLKGNL